MHCVNHPSPTIGSLFVERGDIDLSPEYQREAGVWGIDKQQLFIDSLLNGYDVPKIYMHRLPKGHARKYALVDGKQRLTTLWEFMENGFPLSDGFEFTGREDAPPHPKAKDKYKDLSDKWKERFRALPLSVVVIEDADDSDIEGLFARLNNGESLNAAEKRNAKGGDMCRVIKSVAGHKFFANNVAFKDKRYLYYDIATRFLLIEDGVASGRVPYCDLKKRFLDDLVEDNRTLAANRRKKLLDLTTQQMNELTRVFSKKDPLLRKQGDPQLYYLFVKHMTTKYAGAKLFSQIKKFLSAFHAERVAALALPPEKKGDIRYRWLDDFERLTQQGNDKNSLESRVATMCRFFLVQHSDIEIRDRRRNFSPAEKYAIFVLSDGKCAECGTGLDYDGFEADHFAQWAHGGKTTLDNARALCKDCNARRNQKVA